MFDDAQQLISNFQPHFEKNRQQLQTEIENGVDYKKNVYTL